MPRKMPTVLILRNKYSSPFGLLALSLSGAERGKLFDRGRLVSRGQVSVSHGHLNIEMAHQARDSRQIDSGHDQTTGERVPEIVPSEILEVRCGQRASQPRHFGGDAQTRRLSAGRRQKPSVLPSARALGSTNTKLHTIVARSRP